MSIISGTLLTTPSIGWQSWFVKAHPEPTDAAIVLMLERQRMTEELVRLTLAAGDEAKACYWHSDLMHLLTMSERWWRRLPPRRHRGRPKKSYRDTDQELDTALRCAFQKLNERGETFETIGQRDLLQAMGRSMEDTSRVREMYRRLRLSGWSAMKMYYLSQFSS